MRPKNVYPPAANMVHACPGKGVHRDNEMMVRNAMWAGIRCLLAVATVAAFMLPAAQFTAGAGPDIEVRTDRTPNPGENFTLVFTLKPAESGNYTIQVSPRPELSFMDTSNGSKTFYIATGTSLEYNFPMAVSRSAYGGSYSISYSVLKDGATVKISTHTLKVNGSGTCNFAIVLVPILVAGAGSVAVARRRKV